MILLNIGSKYITIELSKNQEEYLKNSIGRLLLIFSISWMGTRDIYMSIVITAAFIVMTQYLFNEDSNMCILPYRLRRFNSILDKNNDYKVSNKEINDAIKILEKSKKKEQKRKQLQMLNMFK